MNKLYSFLAKYKGLIISWVVVLLLGGYLQKGCSDNRQLKNENVEHQKRIDELQEKTVLLFGEMEKEISYRKQVQDSLLQLSQQTDSLDLEWDKLKEENERFKIIITGIDTDHKRDSVLSAWYPSKGQRNIRPELEN